MFLVLLAACVGKESSDATPPDDSAPTQEESPADSPADSPTDSPDPTGSAPTLTACNAECWEHATGDTFYQWLVECHATDPEGLEDIANGDVTILQGSTTVGTSLVACDRAGYCSASFRETDFNVICLNAAAYQFSVRIVDQAGHWSENLVVTGHAR